MLARFAGAPRLPPAALFLPVLALAMFSYIRNTPNRVGSMKRLSAAEIASPRTRRVSAGAVTPSSPQHPPAQKGCPSHPFFRPRRAFNPASPSRLPPPPPPSSAAPPLVAPPG